MFVCYSLSNQLGGLDETLGSFGKELVEFLERVNSKTLGNYANLSFS